MTEPTIESVSTELLVVPLSRPWGADVRDIRVVTVTVTTNDGYEGFGFSWTPTVGAEAVRALLDHDLSRFAIGKPATPALWQSAWESLHEGGGGGITTIALAGLDLALWDLAARRREISVTDLLGRQHDEQPVYGSGINLHYSLDDLLAQVDRWIGAGHAAVKIKVGKPDLAEDLDRVRAVRELLGPDRQLMVDANQRWDLERATDAAAALEQLDIAWLEEPLRADDTAGYRTLAASTAIPLAAGENAHSVHRFRDLIEFGGVRVVQPNPVRVGGITPFLSIVELARESGVTLAPHLLPELSGQLALALPERTWVEDVEGARFANLGVLAEPSGVTIENATFRGGTLPGLGLRFTKAPSVR